MKSVGIVRKINITCNDVDKTIKVIIEFSPNTPINQLNDLLMKYCEIDIQVSKDQDKDNYTQREY